MFTEHIEEIDICILFAHVLRAPSIKSSFLSETKLRANSSKIKFHKDISKISSWFLEAVIDIRFQLFIDKLGKTPKAF